MSKIVVALGGNALGKNPEEQLEKVHIAVPFLVKLIKDGHELVITHGNGPQVGQIALAMEYSASNGQSPFMPFAECGSMSQGYIGYHLQQVLQDELLRQNIDKDCITIVTQTLVDKNDSAFENPTKPIGAFYTKEEVLMMKDKGYTFVSDSGRGYRRVVPSPKPIDIIEKSAIKKNLESGTIVIATGGGGIPVVRDGGLKGVDAVVDKDLSSALLAKEIDADILLILTTVEKVSIHFNTVNEIKLDELTLEDAKRYIGDNEFAKGSMLPKIEACMNFVQTKKDGKAIITSLEKAYEAMNGNSGTLVKER